MSAEDKKLKHLDFLQLTITRMAANSFLLKAWTVTLVAGLFALAAKDTTKTYVLVAYLPVAMFWLLDGYYLHEERLFRALYDKVRVLSPEKVDLSLSTKGLDSGKTSWFSALFSVSLLMFYGTMLVLLVVVMFVIK